MERTKINAFIKAHQNLSRKELAQKCGISVNAVTIREQQMGLKREWKLVKEKTLAEHITAQKEKGGAKATSTKLKQAVDAIAILEREKEELFKLKKTPQTFVIKQSASGTSEAVAFLIASDWHVEEPVLPAQVNGMNEYNPAIAKTRAANFFANGLRLVKIFKKDTKIQNVVLALLGDFITNTIHEELMESNAMMPGDALWYAKSLICSGIDYLLANSDVHFTIVCHTGNHGRMTKKVHISTEAGNSLERYMYRDIAERYEGNPRLTFIIAEGMHSYLTVFQYTVRFLHGHSIRFNGGVGGVHIPLRKAVSQWDKVKKANLTVMGHFHTMTDGGAYIVNGSLIGYNAFGQFIKADYEQPQQVFFLVHNRKGGEKSVVAPIWLD